MNLNATQAQAFVNLAEVSINIFSIAPAVLSTAYNLIPLLCYEKDQTTPTKILLFIPFIFTAIGHTIIRMAITDRSHFAQRKLALYHTILGGAGLIVGVVVIAKNQKENYGTNKVPPILPQKIALAGCGVFGIMSSFLISRTIQRIASLKAEFNL